MLCRCLINLFSQTPAIFMVTSSKEKQRSLTFYLFLPDYIRNIGENGNIIASMLQAVNDHTHCLDIHVVKRSMLLHRRAYNR